MLKSSMYNVEGYRPLTVSSNKDQMVELRSDQSLKIELPQKLMT